MRRILSLSLLVVAASALAQYPGSAPVPEQYKKGFDAITQSDAREWLGYLAGPECMGRGTLQPGFLKAADYMAAQFAAMGLKPGGDKGTYFQQVPFLEGKVEDGTYLSVGTVKIPIGEDAFSVAGVTKSLELTKPIAVVMGSGESAVLDKPELLTDRIVFTVLDSVPRAYRDALRNSKAAAIIEVTELITNRRNFSIQGTSTRGVTGRVHPTQFGKILEELGIAGAGNGIKMAPPSKRATLSATVTMTREQYVPNVVAILEGSDPTLKNEYVGVGSHLDHLGTTKRGDQEVTYWGADDDGSGSAAILGVAKGLAGNPLKPKRSVVFMAFCGEEMGLIGSGYCAANPPVPLDKMICELQMDMVGRNAEGPQNGNPSEVEDVNKNIDTIRLVGSQRISTELHNLILDVNKYVNFQFRYDREDVYTRSDHYQFASRGVPIAFLFDGFHPDYHKPSDTVDKINFEKLVNSAKLFYLTALEAASRPAPFSKDVKSDGGGN